MYLFMHWLNQQSTFDCLLKMQVYFSSLSKLLTWIRGIWRSYIFLWASAFKTASIFWGRVSSQNSLLHRGRCFDLLNLILILSQKNGVFKCFFGQFSWFLADFAQNSKKYDISPVFVHKIAGFWPAIYYCASERRRWTPSVSSWIQRSLAETSWWASSILRSRPGSLRFGSKNSKYLSLCSIFTILAAPMRT